MGDEEKLIFREKVLLQKYQFNSLFSDLKKNTAVVDFTSQSFYSKLTQFKPVFNFFVYNVDKNIKKFSRGKSGKYVFI
jgi:hypothetical protein